MWMFYLLRRRYVSIINRAAAAFYRRSKTKDLLCYESRGRYATDRGASTYSEIQGKGCDTKVVVVRWIRAVELCAVQQDE